MPQDLLLNLESQEDLKALIYDTLQSIPKSHKDMRTYHTAIMNATETTEDTDDTSDAENQNQNINIIKGIKDYIDSRPYVTTDEYLSGNVREKLHFVQQLNLQLSNAITQIETTELNDNRDRDLSSLSNNLSNLLTSKYKSSFNLRNKPHERIGNHRKNTKSTI